MFCFVSRLFVRYPKPKLMLGLAKHQARWFDLCVFHGAFYFNLLVKLSVSSLLGFEGSPYLANL